MNSRVQWLLVTGGVLAMSAWAPGAPGRIVVANDEWTLSDTGFVAPSDGGIFAVRVAAWFMRGKPGNFLAYSGNLGLVQSQLGAAMKAAGHTWTVSTTTPFTVTNLLSFDAVFVCGPVSGFAPNNQVLIEYVAAGGCVYLAGGTGQVDEATAWSPFLSAYGLRFANGFNGISGHVPISSPHPIMQGIDTLYQLNGSSIIDLEPANAANTIVATHSTGAGLYAVYSTPCVGDINDDGLVNTADLTLLLLRFGQAVVPGSLGDINGDGGVNTTDLTLLLARFGQPC